MQTTKDGPPPPSASDEQLADYLKRLCSDVTLVSNKDGFFVHWVDQISGYISNNFINRFGKLTTDYERIQMAWTITPAHSLQVQQFYKAKDEAAAVQQREEGNAAFQRGALQDALTLYSRAVTRAPHTGSSLCLAYGNRSAALCKLKEYRACLRDARLALQHGYPPRLQHKIYERAGHCYHKLGELAKVRCCYTQALAALRTHSGLEKEKQEEWNVNIMRKLEECGSCDGHDIGGNILLEDPENVAVYDYKGVGEPSLPPEFFQGQNPAMPSASSAVTLDTSPDAGRSAVAAQPVPPDAVLVIETPHAAVLARDKTGAYCTHCCRRLTAAVPCSDCCGVAFCCQQCRDEASVYHRWECRYQDLLHGSGMSLNGYLALRIITQRPLEYFLELRPELEETGLLQLPTTTMSPAATTAHASQLPRASSESLFIPTSKHPHVSKEYTSVYRLVGLQEQRTPLDFLQRTLMAMLLLKVLQRSGYFGPWCENAPQDAAATDNELYIGALLLRNLQVLQFNAHEISGMTFLSDPPAFKKSKSLYLGLAVYPTVAFFNHSCFPAVTRYFLGTRMVVTTVRGVNRGEALAENYGPIFTYHTREQRQRKLLSRYWFSCCCEACTENWGTYPQLRSPLQLRCPHCSKPLHGPHQEGTVTLSEDSKSQKGKLKLSENAAPNANVYRCNKCQKVVEFDRITADMVQAQKLYVSGQEHMEAGRREAAILDMSSYVRAVQQHCVLPYKDAYLAMEALRLLVAARGTCALVVRGKQ